MHSTHPSIKQSKFKWVNVLNYSWYPQKFLSWKVIKRGGKKGKKKHLLWDLNPRFFKWQHTPHNVLLVTMIKWSYKNFLISWPLITRWLKLACRSEEPQIMNVALQLAIVWVEQLHMEYVHLQSPGFSCMSMSSLVEFLISILPSYSCCTKASTTKC